MLWDTFASPVNAAMACLVGAVAATSALSCFCAASRAVCVRHMSSQRNIACVHGTSAARKPPPHSQKPAAPISTHTSQDLSFAGSRSPFSAWHPFTARQLVQFSRGESFSPPASLGLLVAGAAVAGGNVVVTAAGAASSAPGAGSPASGAAAAAGGGNGAGAGPSTTSRSRSSSSGSISSKSRASAACCSDMCARIAPQSDAAGKQPWLPTDSAVQPLHSSNASSAVPNSEQRCVQ